MKFTFGLSVILTIAMIGALAADPEERLQAQLGEEQEEGFGGSGDVFTLHFNDCSRQFCPTVRHECCCEGALSGGKACCEVKTNTQACALYICNGQHWECAEEC
ncbi:hypothetical protein TCAL_07577 [Tigriopus californicus]|uniref:Granulins domain-containing protein n=1 Tax=Tigriopus californicus TaxID=6832 RepID=A0A553PKG3_TIGCA|nr:uncharacterized protein LOC131890031 [Tigriopus californicus]TRY78168.1 hypothetical protein TCAL_07577 [Tigriopus californicus]|eukprot:TCALIF_07577-PA protein Name:"Protein of unknown function" AED:0.00 eAED:0.00 QI:13/1/1/1/0/0.5/2/80/103